MALMSTTSPTVKVIVPWHNPAQLKIFLAAWNVTPDDPRLLLVQDSTHAGCAATKNTGILQAMQSGVHTVIILDDDCLPHPTHSPHLSHLISAHLFALQPQPFTRFVAVTSPPSRGTPYQLPPTQPVAASMGFWEGIPDYDAPAQLVRGHAATMAFKPITLAGQYFPLCGMNIAFRPALWWPWCQFINVPRFDDIWMGYLWQKEAYRRGACFNLAGPIINHSRQSNVWANLRDEARFLELNETLWQRIATSVDSTYPALLKLLPNHEAKKS
jgi:hypothetical protein